MMGCSSYTRTSLMSDESDLELEEEPQDIYRKNYTILLDRCETIQHENERLVYRIHEVKKLTARRKKDLKHIQERLDAFGDDWRNAPAKIEFDIKPEIKPIIPTPPVSVKVEKVLKTETDKPKPTKKATKRKGTKSEKAERDPNAPKRPANPFFQFCQEQRQILMEQLNSELKPGEQEPSKQELTRQLAVKWKSLTGQDKKIYVDMYERSKEKYAVEMSAYNCKN